MEVIAAILAGALIITVAALAAIVVLAGRQLESVVVDNAVRRAELELEWAKERRELLNRIQRPEQTVPQPAEHFEFPEPEPDDAHLVGTIAPPPEELLPLDEPSLN